MATGIEGQVAELAGLADRLLEQGQADEAEGLLAGLLALQPQNPQILRRLGISRAMRGDLAGAAVQLEAAVANGADDPLAFNILSVCRFEAGDDDAALRWAEQALARAPRFVEALNSRGNALTRMGRHTGALADFEAALRQTPDDAILHLNAANARRELGDLNAALAGLDLALRLAPELVEAHVNRGDLMQRLGRHREALASYDRALALAPDSVDGRWNRSLCALRLGEFAEGWRDYEWRWRRGAAETQPRAFSAPPWLGEPELAGRTILLHGEQGLGDCIQFVRYAPQLAAMGARVVLEVYPPLVELCRTVAGVDAVIPRGAALPPVDLHCPLMSLPLALGGAGPPAEAAAYLRSGPARRAAWTARLGRAQALRVGLVASGSATHRGDGDRSLSLEGLLAGLGEGPEYHLLQTEIWPGDRAVAEARPDVTVWAGEIGDFADTAALCELMDLVVCVDTSVAHLAGALGRPVWILLPQLPDWRWGLEGEETAWYPTARLFRQAVAGDWSGPLAAAGRALAPRLAKAA